MVNNITVRDAKIIFRNFSGRETKFTPAGRKTFSLLIEDEEFAQRLIVDGWNVKPLRKRDEDESQHYHMPIAVFFGAYPPTITMISGNTKAQLDESTVGMLDWSDIVKVDLTIRPREYEIAGRKGLKAYLKTMYVTIEEDELAAEYADIGAPIPDDEDVSF